VSPKDSRPLPVISSSQNISNYDLHTIRQRLGANVRRLREQRGWSCACLASRAQIDEDHLAAIEAGEQDRADFDSLIRIRKSLGAGDHELFDGVG